MTYVHKIGKALLAESDERLHELAEVGKEADAEIAALRARVEALEHYVEGVMGTTDRPWVYEEGRALLEQKP